MPQRKPPETTVNLAPRVNHIKNVDVSTGGTLSSIKNFFRSSGLISDRPSPLMKPGKLKRR